MSQILREEKAYKSLIATFTTPAWGRADNELLNSKGRALREGGRGIVLAQTTKKR